MYYTLKFIDTNCISTTTYSSLEEALAKLKAFKLHGRAEALILDYAGNILYKKQYTKVYKLV